MKTLKHCNHPSKIIFLDIDGVLSTIRERFRMWDKEAMSNLEKILKETGASIVVSSSWRDSDMQSMLNHFREYECTEGIINKIIGVTCRGYNYVIRGSQLAIVRGNEIKTYIDTVMKYPWHHDKTLVDKYKLFNEDGSFKMMFSNILNKDYTYLILDDESDMLYDQRNNFIQTNAETGITSEDVLKAITILNKI